MRILVLGGTVFLGRHLTECALARGDEVVHFNRGQSAPGLFPEVETVVGDREHDLDRLAGMTFDAVVDTSGYHPDVVGAATARLAPATDHYTFVSTCSVYADVSRPGVNESAPVATIPGDELDSADRTTHYGGLKALCEKVVADAFPGRAFLPRPGLIVGPHDPSGRFSYWPHRLAGGGEVLAPADPGMPVQLIDVRDLAAWLLASIDVRRAGVFNAVGPKAPLTFGELLSACRKVASSTVEITWVDEAFLLAAGVEPWTELPLWIPAAWEDAAGFAAVDGSRAFDAGFNLRPLTETIADTLADADWARGDSLTAEREAELLAEWRERMSGLPGSARA